MKSSFILQYLELTYPQHPLLPSGVGGTLAARRFELLCDGICDAIVLTFFERLRIDAASIEWLARQRRKFDGRPWGSRAPCRAKNVDRWQCFWSRRHRHRHDARLHVPALR